MDVNMTKEIEDLLLAHTVVTELMKENSRSSYNNNFQVVINAINARVVELLKVNH